MARGTSQRRVLTGTALTVAIILIGHYLGLLAPLERGLTAVLTPLGRFGLDLTHQSEGTIIGAGQAQREQAQLEDRIADLSTENVSLRSALTAVTEATEQSAFLRERRLNGVTARLFARSSDPTSQVVAIDAGTDNGITIGAPVIIRNGILIGRVQTVSARSAQVLLTTDNRSSLAAVMADNPAAQGVVSGVRGLSLSMSLIPQTEELRVGQIAITSGTDDQVPPGLTIGELERFDRQQGAVLQAASLQPLYTTARLDAVTVLTGITL